MTKAGEKLLEGARQALAYARGDTSGARVTKFMDVDEFMELLQAASVSCTGLDITVACDDHGVKSAIFDVLAGEIRLIKRGK